MAHSPEIRTEAFELYLLGNSPAKIAAELQRRHADAAADMPSAKTIEKWISIPDASGRTWSERRYDAEASARDAVTRDFVSAKSKLLSGTLRIQAKMQERAERALDNHADADPENLEQTIYALLNVTRSVDKMLDSSLASEARSKDATDCLIEAMRRKVPGFEQLEPSILAEFQRLYARKGEPVVGQAATPVSNVSASGGAGEAPATEPTAVAVERPAPSEAAQLPGQ